MPVFYNQAMEFGRDLSILVIEHFLSDLTNKVSANTKIKFLDGLAGTGIRGVRIGNEIDATQRSPVSITINDYNPMAYKIITKNIELNNLKNAEPSKKNLNGLLSKNKFNYIDIDPFGSPIEFLDSGVRNLKNNGLLAVTATDTAPLFGRYPRTCLRRYDAWSGRTGFSHELGLRILLGCCVRTAARYNLGLKPLLVHAMDYYYRLYLQGTRSRGAANEALAEVGYVRQYNNSNKYEIISRSDLHHTPNLGLNETTGFKKSKGSKLIGPLWLGKIYNHDFVKGLKIGSHALGTTKQLTRMLALWIEEADAPVGFYDANKISSELRLSTPPLPYIIKTLKSHGFFVTRTHFNPNAFKTDADFETIIQVFKSI